LGADQAIANNMVTFRMIATIGAANILGSWHNFSFSIFVCGLGMKISQNSPKRVNV